MGHFTSHTVVEKQYEAAHAAHYETKNLPEALGLYKRIMAAHPDTEEAKYSRAQIENIVNAVVPKQALFDAHVEMAEAQLEDGDQPD